VRDPRTTTVAIIHLILAKNFAKKKALFSSSVSVRGSRTLRNARSTLLTGKLYCTCLPELSQKAYLSDFVATIRESSYLNLPQVALI